MSDISIIIVSFNTKKLLLDCLSSLKKYTKEVRYEVIVVDNGSEDGSTEAVEKLKGVKLIKNKDNLGFSKANNQGIKKANGRYVLLLNSDTQLVEDSLTKMVLWMDGHQNIGVVSCKLVNTNGSIQATGGSFPTLGRIFLWASFLDDLPFIGSIFGSYHPKQGQYYENEHQQDWVTGAFLLTRSEVVKKVGDLDEIFFMYGEDVEFCLRVVKSGWQVWYTPLTRIVHLGSKSTERSILGEFNGLHTIYQKHFPLWQYPILLLLTKFGAFLRIILFGILGRRWEALKIYAKAF